MDVVADVGGDGLGEDEEEEDAEEERRKNMKEVKLDLPRRIARLADPQTVCNYVWVLKGWRTNGDALNGVVLRFLRRLEELGIERMLHQVSVLMVLHEIISDPIAKAEPRFHDVFRFARGVVRGMFARLCPKNLRRQTTDGYGHSSWEPVPDDELETGDRARRAAARMGFLDLCFWKTRSQAIQMDFDSGLDFPAPNAAAAAAQAKASRSGPVLHTGLRVRTALLCPHHHSPPPTGPCAVHQRSCVSHSLIVEIPSQALCEDDEEADADGTVVGIGEKEATRKGLFTFAQLDRFKARLMHART